MNRVKALLAITLISGFLVGCGSTTPAAPAKAPPAGNMPGEKMGGMMDGKMDSKMDGKMMKDEKMMDEKMKGK